ncbi:MAG: hypothetical protein MJZ25_03595 [Fibrobacter sp.]|nr:hypothetical protein [Fibrobacter sp.]
MFNELEQLKQLTRSIEMESIEMEASDPDLGAVIIDGVMDNSPYVKGDPCFVAVIEGQGKKESKADADDEKTDDEKQPKHVGSSGTPGKNTTEIKMGDTKSTAPAIFEKNDTAESVEECFLSGVGSAMKQGMHRFESCVDGPEALLQPGTFAAPKHCANGKPVIMYITSNDGGYIKASMPTKIESNYAHSGNGCWPKFIFESDELTPMSDISKDQIHDVIAFNDNACENDLCACKSGFDGETPMKQAQEMAQYGQQDKPQEHVDIRKLSDLLDIISGIETPFADQDTTVSTPVMVSYNDDGSISAQQQSVTVKNNGGKHVAPWGSSMLEF